MTQPNQTTPIPLSGSETGPWTIYRVVVGRHFPGNPAVGEWRVRNGDEPLFDDTEQIEVIPLSTLSKLVEELEARAENSKAIGNAAEGDETIETLRAGEFYAYQDAASLISESLPKGKSDE